MLCDDTEAADSLFDLLPVQRRRSATKVVYSDYETADRKAVRTEYPVSSLFPKLATSKSSTKRGCVVLLPAFLRPRIFRTISISEPDWKKAVADRSRLINMRPNHEKHEPREATVEPLD